nr:glycosyltransferase [Myxococcota bacterium]
VLRIPPAVAPLAVPSEAQRGAARALFDVPISAPLITFPGDLDRGEGAPLAIESLEALPDLVLAIACRPKTSRAKDAERALRARAETLGVGARVRWIGETPHVLALLGASDVVVLPSRDLGAKVDLPIVLLEAMWQARPIIVATRSAAEELADDDAAFAIEPERDAMIATLRALIDDPTARAAAGARARAAAIARHDPAVMARRYESVYDGLLA